jgi:hypothetical protein
MNGCDSNQNATAADALALQEQRQVQRWSQVSSTGSVGGLVGIGGGAEYTHYYVPNSTAEVILHRTKVFIACKYSPYISS